MSAWEADRFRTLTEYHDLSMYGVDGVLARAREAFVQDRIGLDEFERRVERTLSATPTTGLRREKRQRNGRQWAVGSVVAAITLVIAVLVVVVG